METNPNLGIVEDESIIAQDLVSLLEQLDYQVAFHATSGEECLGKVADHDVDLVIMDIDLEMEFDGIRTAKKLQERDVPVVYLTAYTDDETLRRAMETDPLGYLSKPVNETDLRTTLSVAVRKQEMQRELRGRERKYRELIETSPDIIFRLNPNKEFTFLSSNISMLGYSPDELVGKKFTEILHSDEVDRVSREQVLPKFEGKETGDRLAPDLFDERRTGERATRNLEVKLTVGSEGAREEFGTQYPTFEVNSAGLFRENDSSEETEFVGSVGILRNIMDRKEAEEELRLKERAMSSAKEGITIATADGGDNPLIYVNEGFVEMTGYRRAWAIGRDCRFLQGERTDPEKIEEMGRAIENEEPVTVEVINYRKNGEPFWNKVSITPVRDSEDNVTHYVGIQQDITEQKKQEEELRQAEKLAAIGEMSAGLMHEINNPNAFIQGNIEYLQKAWDKIYDAIPDSTLEDSSIQSFIEEFDETLNDMHNGTRRIDEIVNNVKLFSRRERSDQEKQEFDPIPVVQEALTLFESYDSDLFEPRVHRRGDNGTIEGDPTEVSQIVTNLVKNAIDAVNGDCDEEPAVILEASMEPDEFLISVQDYGPGIPSDVKPKIFDPFYTTKPTGEGTGLGLSIVKGIVDRLDGEIMVNSSEDVGTRFEVVIPRSDE